MGSTPTISLGQRERDLGWKPPQQESPGREEEEKEQMESEKDHLGDLCDQGGHSLGAHISVSCSPLSVWEHGWERYMLCGEVLTLPGEALASVRALGDHLLELSLTLNSLT